MSIVFVTYHDENFHTLAELTAPNKKDYCQRHGYTFFTRSPTDWSVTSLGQMVPSPANHYCRGQKFLLLKQACENYPTAEWFFFSECDTYITNPVITLEDILATIAPQPSEFLLITTDCNAVNGGSFFLRNTPDSRLLLDEVLQMVPQYRDEQYLLTALYSGTEESLAPAEGKYREAIKLCPQRLFNAYQYEQYPPHFCYSGIDQTGHSGQWQMGDFMVHWAGFPLQWKVELAQMMIHRLNEQHSESKG